MQPLIGIRRRRNPGIDVELAILALEEQQRTRTRPGPSRQRQHAADDDQVVAAVVLRVRPAFDPRQRVGQQRNACKPRTRRHAIPFVGQGAREEVDYEPAGAGGRNYGWSVREGWIPTPGVSPTRQPAFTPLTNPLFDYGRTIGRAVTGGFVYRGSQVPALVGYYVFGDYCSGRVWTVWHAASKPAGEQLLMNTTYNISSFGEDEAGELYLVDRDGGDIYRFAP